MTLPGRLAPIPFAGPLGGAIPFIGRTTERQGFAALLSEAGAGEPRLCLIRGEPGTGKSRLALEFLAEADTAGWQTLKGRCLEGAVSPFAPFAAEVLPRMRQAGLLPPAAAVAEPAPPATDGPAFARLFVDLAARRPLVFVIDDLQLLEGGALTFFRDLCMALSDLGRNKQACVIVVATLRLPAESAPVTEALDRLTREPIARVIDITGFGEVETNELVRRATGKNCDPLLLGFLSEATRGNPLFLGEALRELSARGALSEEGGSLHANVDLDHLVLPNSAPAVIRQRLERLPAELVPVLELAALLGEEFAANTLVATGGAADPGPPLDGLASEGVLLGDGEHFRFSHALIRQAAIEGIPPGRRRALHQQIADGLLAAFGANSEHILEIAEHRAHASTADDTETAHFFETAGDAAMESFAWNLGARYYARAVGNAAYVAELAVGERGKLYAKLAGALVHCGDRHAGRELYEKSMPLLRIAAAEIDLGRAILAWERTYTTANEVAPPSAEAALFLGSTGLAAQSLRVALLAHRAEVLWLRRDAADEGAIALAIAEARDLNDPVVRAQVHVTTGLVRMRHLQPRESAAAFRECIRETENERNPEVRGWGRARLALPLAMLGEIEAASRVAEESLREALAAQAWAVAALNLGILSCLDALRDGSAGARRRVEFASIMRERSGYPLAGFFLDSAAATIRLRAGELEEAEDAILSWERTAGRYLARPLLLAHREAVDGADAVALDLRTRPFQPHTWDSLDFSSLGSLAAWTDVANRTQSIEIAEALIEPLKSALDEGIEFSVVPPALLSRCAATVAMLLGRYLEAASFLTHAEAIAEQSGSKVELGLVHLAAAELAVVRGDNVEAIAGRARAALRVFSELDMIREAGRARAIIGEAGREQPLLLSRIPGDELSGSEFAVLKAMAEGMNEGQAATALFLSERTVSRHLRRITLRLGIRSRDEASQFLKARNGTVADAAPSPQESRLGLRSTVPLSRREREVLERIALGRTNQQIADELFISLYTVVRHVANIFDKTGSANRTEAARFL